MIAFFVAAVLAAPKEIERPTPAEVAGNVKESYAKYAEAHAQKTLPEYQAMLERQIDETTHDLDAARRSTGARERAAMQPLSRSLAAAKKELAASKKPGFETPKPEKRLSDFEPADCKFGEVGFFQTGVVQDSGWSWTATVRKVLTSDSVLVKLEGERQGARTGGPDMKMSTTVILKGAPTKGLVPKQTLNISGANLIYADHVDSPVPAERERIYEVFDPSKPFE